MMMTTNKLHINDLSCRQLYDAAAALFFVHSGETTGAYFGVLKVSDDVVVVVHDESSFSCRLDTGFHAF